MDSQHIGKNPTFVKSTLIAARGFVTVVRSERKIRLGLVVAGTCIAAAVWVRASYVETLMIVCAWTQVIVGEIFNTSLEKAMDYASGKEFHPLIKRGKDYAAASVFVLCIFASFLSVFILSVRW